MKNKKWMAILLGGIMAASLAAPCSVSAAEKTTHHILACNGRHKR